MVACKTYKSFGLIADDENGIRNACGNCGGLKSCLLTVTLGCRVTSTSESSSLASGVIADGGFCTVTVPLTAVAADAGVSAEAVAAAEGLPLDSLEPPHPASSSGATSNDATTSFRMGGIPRDGIGAHRMRRTGTSPRVDAGQNFHVTAGRCATKDIVLAAFTRDEEMSSPRELPVPAMHRETSGNEFDTIYL